MAGKSLLQLLPFLLVCSSWLTSPASCTSLPIKAVNLGGWLAVEGWITPSLFARIPNGDLLLWRMPGSDSMFKLRVSKNVQFVGLGSQGDGNQVVAVASTPDQAGIFQIIRKNDDPTIIRIMAAENRKYVQAESATLVTADYESETSWGSDDPSVFTIKFAKQMQGEFQLCNAYGIQDASRVLQEHWQTFIVEEDFKFISQKGLNAVRIPVGWRITSELNPSSDSPFVSGHLEALDTAFGWADKHNLGVTVDLHAAPGSQNGDDYSGSRDGSLESGSDATIDQTVQAVKVLAERQ